MAQTNPSNDEVLHLAKQVDELFGEDAVVAANNRAYDAAMVVIDADPDQWLTAFNAAFLAELRRLLAVH